MIKKIYTYKDFLKYDEVKGEGGIYYSRWNYAEEDMIHIEGRFKDIKRKDDINYDDCKRNESL